MTIKNTLQQSNRSRPCFCIMNTNHCQSVLSKSNIDQFRKRYSCNNNISLFKKLPFRQALRHAALAIDSNCKKYLHQRRLKQKALNKSLANLTKIKSNIKSCKSFDQLHALLDSKLQKVKGLGTLFIYDTAFRLGVNLGLYPQKVYLHAGTRMGAKRLDLNYEEPYLEMKEVPRPLRKLKPYQVEDFLCIYKNKF